MSSVPNSGDTWKDKVERLCTSNIIGRGQVYRILVLSGTHGSINPDGTISVSGFTRKNLLDKDQYIDDFGYAKFLMKKMANDGFKLEIEVANMLDFCKPLGPKKDLCEFVHGKNPNMVVMAWCYSTNGKFYVYIYIFLNQEISEYLSKSNQNSNKIPKSKEYPTENCYSFNHIAAAYSDLKRSNPLLDTF